MLAAGCWDNQEKMHVLESRNFKHETQWAEYSKKIMHHLNRRDSELLFDASLVKIGPENAKITAREEKWKNKSEREVLQQISKETSND